MLSNRVLAKFLESGDRYMRCEIRLGSEKKHINNWGVWSKMFGEPWVGSCQSSYSCSENLNPRFDTDFFDTYYT